MNPRNRISLIALGIVCLLTGPTQAADRNPKIQQAIDRGGTYNSATYTAYVNSVGAKRTTAMAGMTITLDAGSANPVTIQIIALNGNGISTTNENDLSVVAVVHFGQFDAEIGGDLSGYKTASYEDIETSVAPLVRQVEVYKVHHHGSAYSSNDNWLGVIKPMVAVISASSTIGRNYDHPTQECVERLHNAGIKKTYWTEQGTGAVAEPGLDVIGGNIIVETSPGSATFTVTYAGMNVDTYPMWGAASTPTISTSSTTPLFAWSKKSNVYHHANCSYVQNISPQNLETGNTPPPGKTLHQACPH